MRFLLLLAALCITGCSEPGGEIGDENDPAVSGQDAEIDAMDESGGV